MAFQTSGYKEVNMFSELCFPFSVVVPLMVKFSAHKLELWLIL